MRRFPARTAVLGVVFALLVAAVLVGTGATRPPGRATGSAAIPTTTDTGAATAPPATTPVTSPAANAATVTRITHVVVAAAKSGAAVAVPTGFRASLDRLYRSMYGAADVIPGSSRFAHTDSPATFDAAVGALSTRSLGYAYLASKSAGGFTSAEASVAAFVPVERAAVRALRMHASTPPRSAASVTRKSATAHDTSGETPQDLTSIPDTMPQTGSFGGGTGGTAYIVSCPSYWSTSIDPYADNAIYALQIVIDVAGAVYNAASSFDDAFPVSAIADALTLVAQEVQNDGIYLKGDYANCEINNIQEAGLDIDNSTYQTYALLTSVAGTANEADTNLVALINQNAADFQFELQGIIESALTDPATSPPVASLELPATSGGYLDSVPVGVQEVVTSEINNLESAGQLSSPLADRDLGLADQAYAAAQYKSAFLYYRLAYQAASQ